MGPLNFSISVGPVKARQSETCNENIWHMCTQFIIPPRPKRQQPKSILRCLRNSMGRQFHHLQAWVHAVHPPHALARTRTSDKPGASFSNYRAKKIETRTETPCNRAATHTHTHTDTKVCIKYPRELPVSVSHLPRAAHCHLYQNTERRLGLPCNRSFRSLLFLLCSCFWGSHQVSVYVPIAL